MADRVSKQVLSWQVTGEAAAVQSVGRVQAAINNQKKAVDQLHQSLTDLRVEDAAKELGQKFGTLAGDIEKSDAAAKQLSEELFKIGASKTEIAAAASEFERFRKAQSELPTFSDSDLGVSGGGKNGLSALGSKIRGLPSVQIPGGGGIGTDAIGNLLRVVGSVGVAALPAAAALAAVGAALVVVNKTAPDVTAGIREVTALDKNYYEARIKGTKDSINALIEQKQIEQKIAQARVDDLSFVAKGYDELHAKTGIIAPGLDAIVETFGALGATNFKDIRDARIAYDQAQEELKKANKELGLYNGLIDAQSVAINTATEELKKFNAEVAEQTIQSIKERADVQQEIDKIVAEGSEKELDAKKKQLEATQKNAETQLKDLKTNIDYAKQGSDEQRKYQDEFKKQLGIYNDATYELSQLSSAAVEAAVKLNDANEYKKKQDKELADATRAFNEDLAKENENDFEKRASIEKKYQDALIKAADTLADAGARALQQLKDKRADLLTSFGRNELSAGQKAQQKALEDQIAIQEKSAAEARDHQRELLKIQEDAQEREIGLIQSRDFAGLFNSRRQTTKALQDSNKAFTEKQAEEALQNKQKSEADARQYEFERQQRLQAFQYANEDAGRNYARQIDQANLANAKALQQASNAANQELQLQDQKHIQAINILNNGIRSELSIISQGAAARIQLEAATQQALIDQARRILSSGGNSLLGNGQAGFGGGSTGFGAITNNSGGNAVTNNFNIHGNNPQAIGNHVEQIVNRTLRTYLVD